MVGVRIRSRVLRVRNVWSFGVVSPFDFFFFFFNDTATTEIYTLSLHDALPISMVPASSRTICAATSGALCLTRTEDRKSTRLNSSHGYISYAVFCLKKKKNTKSRTYSPQIPNFQQR